MSETPKKIEFMMMKVSASELLIARSVAFNVSAPNWECVSEISTYNATFFNDVNRRVHIVLGCQ